MSKLFFFDATFQGLAGRSFTFFNNDLTRIPTPEILHRAALTGNLRMLFRALKAGVPVDVTDTEGTTALILACRYNNYNCAKMLLIHGADPMAQRLTGPNSLCYAIQNGYLSFVKLLLKYGAHIHDCGLEGGTPFLLACQLNHVDIVKEIVDHINDKGRITQMLKNSHALYVAAQQGHKLLLTYLVACGIDVNDQKSDGTSSLFIACQMGHGSLVHELINLGADVNLPRNDGCTPLFKAAHKGYANIVHILISSGASFGLLPNGETALHAAVDSGHVEVVKVLIKAGADPNLRNRCGVAPLTKSLRGGLQHVSNCLLRRQDEVPGSSNTTSDET